MLEALQGMLLPALLLATAFLWCGPRPAVRSGDRGVLRALACVACAYLMFALTRLLLNVLAHTVPWDRYVDRETQRFAAWFPPVSEFRRVQTATGVLTAAITLRFLDGFVHMAAGLKDCADAVAQYNARERARLVKVKR